jgi:hypothetical protein
LHQRVTGSLSLHLLLSLHFLSVHLLLHCYTPSRPKGVTAWTRREGAGARKTTWTRSWDATRACVVASAPWRPWAKRGMPSLPPPPAQHRGAPESYACSKCRQSASQLLRAVASRALNRPGNSPVPSATYARVGRDGCASLPPLLASLPRCRITWLSPEEGAKAGFVTRWRVPHQCLALRHAAFPDRRQACAYVSPRQCVCVCLSWMQTGRKHVCVCINAWR